MSIEYKIINGEDARKIDPDNLPWPDSAKVVYAFENDQIIGRLALMNMLHIEGAWIKEDRRNGIILSRLFNKIEEIIMEANKASALSFIDENNTDAINLALKRNYVRLPYTVFLKILEE